MEISNRATFAVLIWERIEHNAKQQTFLVILDLGL